MENLSHVSQSSSGKNASQPLGGPVPQEEGEIDLVATWLKFDLPRTIAGAVAGIFAGMVAMVVAGLLAKSAGMEFWYPFKIPAAPFLHNGAMTYGMTSAIFVGVVVHSILCAILGMIFSHFVKTNQTLPLLGAGFMWGTFSWIFINNLFVKSFQNVMELDIPAGSAFLVYLVFGFSLSSIRLFDRIICGRAR